MRHDCPPPLIVPVYPRWRGEHARSNGHPAAIVGLSPLARGTSPGQNVYFALRRFIPAGAGNIPVKPSDLAAISVYPRWRGEHTNYILLFYNKFIHKEQSTDIFATN